MFEVRRELIGLSLEILVEAAFQFLTEAVGAFFCGTCGSNRWRSQTRWQEAQGV
jgi:hypothetical protein